MRKHRWAARLRVFQELVGEEATGFLPSKRFGGKALAVMQHLPWARHNPKPVISLINPHSSPTSQPHCYPHFIEEETEAEEG